MITNKCNQSCAHCVSNSYGQYSEELEYDALINALVSINNNLRDFAITLVGGEATIWPRFYDLLKSSEFRGIKNKMLYTNATALNDERIIAIRDAGFYEVRVSIDSDRKDEHDDLRGNGTFDKTLDAVQKMISAGIPVSSATVLKKSNVKRIGDIVQLMKSLGIKMMHLIPLYFNGRGFIAKDCALTPDDYRILVEKLQSEYSDIFRRRSPLCTSGTAYFRIECNGDCNIQQGRERQLLGNIYNDDFSVLYDSAIRRFSPAIFHCENCSCYTSPILCENMYSYCLADLKLIDETE